MREMLVLGTTVLAWVLPGCNPNGDSRVNVYGGEHARRNDDVTLSTVALSVGEGAFCSGTYIGGNTIVTAAHCVADKPKICNGSVVWGTSQGDAKTKISRVVMHKLYNPGDVSARQEPVEPEHPQYDVAVLRFQGNPPKRWFAKAFKPAKVIEANAALSIGQDVVLAGFGKDHPLDQYGGLLMAAPAKLTQIWEKSKELVVDDPHVSGAHGDSGGPLYIRQGTDLMLIGIAARARPVNFEIPGITGYEDVRFFRSWIEKNSGLQIATGEQGEGTTTETSAVLCEP